MDVYRAVCEACSAVGPESPGSQRGARSLAVAAGWLAEKVRVARGSMLTYVWVVRCPTCRGSTQPARR